MLLRYLDRLEGRKVSTETEAHEGPVYALYAYPASDGSGTCLVTGGGDGKVKTWDAEVCTVQSANNVRLNVIKSTDWARVRGEVKLFQDV